MKKFVLMTFCLSFLASSCWNPFADSDDPKDENDFEDYTFEQQVICFCPAPPAGVFFKLKVRDDEIVEAENTETGEKLEARQFSYFKTISELIELANSIDENAVATFDVNYDEEYGYPSYLYIDYSANIADEEIGYRSRNFERD